MPLRGSLKAGTLFEENHVMASHAEANSQLVAQGREYASVAERRETPFTSASWRSDSAMLESLSV